MNLRRTAGEYREGAVDELAGPRLQSGNLSTSLARDHNVSMTLGLTVTSSSELVPLFAQQGAALIGHPLKDGVRGKYILYRYKYTLYINIYAIYTYTSIYEYIVYLYQYKILCKVQSAIKI